MATGHEHYREAEKHIDYAQSNGDDNPKAERAHLMYAQAHATLALVGLVDDAVPATAAPLRARLSSRETVEQLLGHLTNGDLDQVDALVDALVELVHEVVREHAETEPHIHADGSTS